MTEPIAIDSTLPPTGTAPEVPVTPAPEPQVTASPPAPAEKMLPQSEVNRLLAAERRKTREQAERELRPQTPAAQAQATAATAPMDALSEIRQLRTDLAFTETLNESGLTLSKKQREVLRGHFDPANPESIVELARQVYGLRAPPAAVAATPSVVAAAPTPQGAAAERPPGPVYASPGAPMGSPDAGLDSDPTSWTRDQTKAYEADGTLMARVEAWKAKQPGGGGRSLFPNRATKR